MPRRMIRQPQLICRSIAFRAEEARLAPAHDVAIGVDKRPTGPVAAGASDGPADAVHRVRLPAGLDDVLRAVAAGDHRADHGAADDAGDERAGAPAPAAPP